MQQTSELSIISQQLFEEYTMAWRDFIDSANAAELTLVFRPETGQYLPFVSLPCEQLIALLSTLGMRQVKARFALLPAVVDTRSRFAVALFATDDSDVAVSAYYLATGTWQPVAATQAACRTSVDNSPVPLALAATWLANWTEATQVTPVMFETTPAPVKLQGYNFTVRDFVDPLFALKSGGISDQTLRVHLGLHHYYGATLGSAGPDAQQTLGLVLRLAGTDVGDAPYYDMAQEVPPGH